MKVYRKFAVVDVSEELVEKVQQKDEEATSEFLSVVDPYIDRIAYNVNLINTTPEDLSKFLKDWIYDQLGKYEPKKGKFNAWFNSVIRGAISYYQKRIDAKAPRTFYDFEEETIGVPSAIFEEVEVQDALEKVREEVNPTARRIIDLRLEGKSYTEIAEVLGFNISTINWYMKKLRPVFEKYLRATKRPRFASILLKIFKEKKEE